MNKHEILSKIYTELWKYYKQFLQDKDMKQYNLSCQKLVKEILALEDGQMLSFCQNQIINFAPIINELKGEK